MLCNNVEVINAPATKTAFETAVDIAKSVNISITENYIQSAYRIKNNKKLIIKFASINTKINLMKKCKEA